MGKRNGGAVDGRDPGHHSGRPMSLSRPTGTQARSEVGGSQAGPSADGTPIAGPAFEADLRLALGDGRIAEARTLVANAEAVLAAHEFALKSGKTGVGGPVVSRPDLASAKARIAMATGDLVAAHAILVQSIEHNPEAAGLRALMAETMFASGRATDIRPVLQNLGRPPVSVSNRPGDEVPPLAADKKG